MLGANVDELKKLVGDATQWRAQEAARTPTPIDLIQVVANINGKAVIIAWNPEANDWEVTAA